MRLLDRSAYPVVSLFSGAGIGDTGFRDAGLKPLVLSEIDPRRSALAELNFPEAQVAVGDLRQRYSEVVQLAKDQLQAIPRARPFLLSATPPCQGMSKNGIGTILKAMRHGKRPRLDERNYLYKHVIRMVGDLTPDFLFFENVDRMVNTYVLNGNKNQIRIIEHFQAQMEEAGYVGGFRVLDVADFGLPQHRRRTIGLFGRQEICGEALTTADLFPQATHSGNRKNCLLPHVSVEDAIGTLPALDSKDRDHAVSSFHALHKVPVSRSDLYYWISHTAPGKSAYENNTCPNCQSMAEQRETRCPECGTLLPKPVVMDRGKDRLIRGYVSTYCRMIDSEPAHTVTTRSAYACSDRNLHPTQNRVLSLYEIALLQGMEPDRFVWGPVGAGNGRSKSRTRARAPDTLIRDVIGEALPPLFSRTVGEHLLRLQRGEFRKRTDQDLRLF